MKTKRGIIWEEEGDQRYGGRVQKRAIRIQSRYIIYVYENIKTKPCTINVSLVKLSDFSMLLQVTKQKLEYCWWAALKISGAEGRLGGGTGWGQIWRQLRSLPGVCTFPCRVQGARRMAKLGMGGHHALTTRCRWYAEERSPEKSESSQESLLCSRWETMAFHLLPLLALRTQQRSGNR